MFESNTVQLQIVCVQVIAFEKAIKEGQQRTAEHNTTGQHALPDETDNKTKDDQRVNNINFKSKICVGTYVLGLSFHT